MPFTPSFLTYEDLRDAADGLLAEYHPKGTIPVPIEEIVEFDLSMDVVPLEGLRAQLDVDAFLSNDLEWVYVDQYVLQHAPARYRFSLAHEVAHYWLHDQLYRECSIQSVADWAAVQHAIGEQDYRWFEWQANNFAGLVLVPGALLKARFQVVTEKLSAAGLAPKQLDRHPTRAFVISDLAKQFAVSEQTMEIRLERDGLLAALRPGP